MLKSISSQLTSIATRTINSGLCLLGLTSLMSFSVPVLAQTMIYGGQNVSVNMAAGTQSHYVLNVPSETKSVSFKLSGGTGNADLYVQQNVAASPSSYYAKSTGPTNEENISKIAASSRYFVLVNALTQVQGATLVASYEASEIYFVTNGVPMTGISLAKDKQRYFVITVPAGKSKLTYQLSGGTGDGDIYLKYGALPSTTNYEKRSMGASNVETISIDFPRAGTYYLLLQAVSNVSAAKLLTTFQ
ncbi:PPC domain-containing protein [Undibacterium flavidum]|uniref:PPC domain-containing protein n=1 Tax=Undibacterium flavidum TaxID=2762297 RepID=A0ABR6YHB7_9BURK|nr:PPC domain-containing protein [Undibacterium flavidum]MBC3875923.1 PPC domain-containing protein [Undibacterium flavidum]